MAEHLIEKTGMKTAKVAAKMSSEENPIISQVTLCSTCGDHMQNTQCSFMRRMLDRFLYPCSYKKYGCNHKPMAKDDQTRHEQEDCRFKLYKCPFRMINKCTSFVGNGVELTDHLHIDHHRDPEWDRERTATCEDAVSLMPKPFMDNYQVIDKTACQMSANLRIFDSRTFVFSMYHLHNLEHRAHFFLVRIIGSKAESEMYECKMTFHTWRGDKVYKSKVQSMHEDAIDIYHSRQCLILDCATITKYKLPHSNNLSGRSNDIFCDIEIRHKSKPL